MARIQTTPLVRFTLRLLVAYVAIMLALILVRFLRIFPQNPHPPKKAAVVGPCRAGTATPPRLSQVPG